MSIFNEMREQVDAALARYDEPEHRVELTDEMRAEALARGLHDREYLVLLAAAEAEARGEAVPDTSEVDAIVERHPNLFAPFAKKTRPYG